MKLDFLETKTLWLVAIFSFFVFLFLPFELGMKIFLSSLFLYFLTLFFLCTYWANDWHPERKFIIGFLVSFLHSFVFLFAGILGLALAQVTLKFFPLLVSYFRGI
jgi:hypothetical protein